MSGSGLRRTSWRWNGEQSCAYSCLCSGEEFWPIAICELAEDGIGETIDTAIRGASKCEGYGIRAEPYAYDRIGWKSRSYRGNEVGPSDSSIGVDDERIVYLKCTSSWV